MRKLAKVSALVVGSLMLFAFTNSIRPTSFEGVITYQIKVDGDNAQAAQMMQGSTIKVYIKGDMSRSESNFGMFKSISIYDKKKPDGGVTCMDIMGNKYQLKMDDKMKKQAEDAKPEISYLTGTKTIAGYACKEAQAKIKDKKSGQTVTADIYYTEDIPSFNDNAQAQFRGLKGFPMSYNMTQNGMNMTMTVQAIDKQSVPDSLFTVPTGYKVMTQEEMQKDMMSHMGGGGGN